MKRATTAVPRLIGAALSVLAIAWTSVSRAQESGTPPPPALEGSQPPTATPPPPPPPPPAPPPLPPPVTQQEPPPPPPATEPTDLDVKNRRIGIGYAGVSQIPVFAGMGGTIT